MLRKLYNWLLNKLLPANTPHLSKEDKMNNEEQGIIFVVPLRWWSWNSWRRSFLTRSCINKLLINHMNEYISLIEYTRKLTKGEEIEEASIRG